MEGLELDFSPEESVELGIGWGVLEMKEYILTNPTVQIKKKKLSKKDNSEEGLVEYG